MSYPIRHTSEFTEVGLGAGIAVRTFGRIVTDNGRDVTDDYFDDGEQDLSADA